MNITQNKLLWMAIGILIVIQIVVLYQVIDKPTSGQRITSSEVTTVSKTIRNIVADKTQSSINTIIAGSDVMYIQGYLDSYENNVLSLTISDGTKVQVIVSTNTEIVTVDKNKSQTQIDEGMIEYISQLTSLYAGGEKNIEELKLLELPKSFITSTIQMSDLNKGDTIAVDYSFGNPDRPYDAIRIVLLPQRR